MRRSHDDVVDTVARGLRPAMEVAAAEGRGPPVLVVALSGGLDSCVLLHALRFGPLDAPLVAAHFDHRMRPSSTADAAWVQGLCRAWDVDLVHEARGGAGEDDRVSEADARRLRYGFLHAVRRRHDPALLITAHHADDQAETVLFRILRGTGIDGLAGIPAVRSPGIVRPLLPLWRNELEAYAHRHGLSWREDPTNRDVGYARNRVRHEILPLAERVAPGAARAIVRLSRIAGAEATAWSEALDRIISSLDPRREPTGDVPDRYAARISLDRAALAGLEPALRARVLRHLIRHHLDGGGVPGKEATDRAVDFVAAGASGRRIQLGGGVEMARELDRIELRRASSARGPSSTEPDREAVISGDGCGTAEARLGGRFHRVRWARTGPGSAEGGVGPVGEDTTSGSEGRARTVLLPVADVALPLRLRARRPGDRVVTTGGTRKLKKVLLEARVPAAERDRLPVLVDARDRVLWVAGVVRESRRVSDAGAPRAHESMEGAPAAGDVLRITVVSADARRMDAERTERGGACTCGGDG